MGGIDTVTLARLQSILTGEPIEQLFEVYEPSAGGDDGPWVLEVPWNSWLGWPGLANRCVQADMVLYTSAHVSYPATDIRLGTCDAEGK